MLPFRSIEPDLPRQARGDALIEAMVGVLLMAIVGLGTTYAASRIAIAQKHQSVQNTAIMQMRAILRNTDSALLCDGTTVPTVRINNTDYTLSVSCPAAATVTVGTASILAPRSVTLTLSNAGLLGGAGTLIVTDGT